MKILTVLSQGYGANTYVLKSENAAAVIDPAADIRDILDTVSGLPLTHIFLTHGHYDHMINLTTLRKISGASVYIHICDGNFLTDAELNVSTWIAGRPVVFEKADIMLKDGDVIGLGDELIRVIHSPGHTPGSSCFLCGNNLFCGDAVFAHGYGRYDLPGGSMSDTEDTLCRFSLLDKKIRLFPGHGPSCSVGEADALRGFTQ
ncbi:MAG: MBL fold metallo-hydrolase [Clostridia bacterium]|nr:MBL fold metallo-hydrolase [Clostridia bacterium]